MTGSIYISYRRADTHYAASVIQGQLAAHFGRDRVFRDGAAIEPGDVIPRSVGLTVGQFSVCLAIIGPNWLSSRRPDGTRRIDDRNDWVRREIEAVLSRRVPVIPVLVGNATLPAPDELPLSLRPLSRLNAVVIPSGRDIPAGVQGLIESLEHFFEARQPDVPVLPHDILPDSRPDPADVTPGPIASEQPVGTAFISYRRDGGAETARLLRYELLARGWHVFLDVEDLKEGLFDDRLLDEVARADNFLLVLSPGALAGCFDEEDWLRKEIRHALTTNRHVVPVLKERVARPSKKDVPDDIERVTAFNCIDYSHVYYDAMIIRLLEFLTARKT